MADKQSKTMVHVDGEVAGKAQKGAAAQNNAQEGGKTTVATKGYEAAVDNRDSAFKAPVQNEEEPYFCAQNLVVGYDGVPLIKEVNIRLNKGDIFTMIGPNGAGKSTILKTITKQLPRIGGNIYLGGEDIFAMSPKTLAQNVAVVLTERIRPELMTCEEVVGMGRYPYTGSLGLLREEDAHIVEQVMERVHITDYRDKDFSAISDGQRQRVMLARALAQEPELLILDEPTSFLDVRYKLELLNILQEMARERNMTVIMSLHELDLAERVSNKIMTIKGHDIDRFGTQEEIFTPGYVSELYELTVGSYEEANGRVELARVEGEPQAFVVCGNGTGIPIFRKLQRMGIPFAAGVLAANDQDYPVACSLAVQVVEVPAFLTPDDAALQQARHLMDTCGKVIVAYPHPELTSYAQEQGLTILTP